MRFHLPLLILLTFSSLLAPAGARAQDQALPGDYRPGAVIVGFRPGAAAASVERLSAEGFQVAREFPSLGMVELRVPVGDEEATAARLARRPDALFAEPDYRAYAQVSPNDPDFAAGKQWALAIMNAPAAWSVTTGSQSAVIAVLDTGIDIRHPDLASKLWVNRGEIADNARDDDANGMIDDVHGWRFNSADGTDPEPGGDKFIQDDNGHGTHVSGIAAAATDNGIGVAGVAWHSPIMTVKVLTQYSWGWYSDIAAGILYAADNGASVINMSLGGTAESQALCSAVSAAVARGKLVVAAAGNKDTQVYYPAACPGALAVGATNRSDEPASFTNPGARVDLAAPGVDIWSAWYLPALQQHSYAAHSGTSAATPHVSAAAALIWARWPALTVDGVKAQLQGSVEDVGRPGRDDETGWGRIDLARAVAAPVSPVDLRLDAEVLPSRVVAGNPITATFTVVNEGAAPASSVTLNVTLPAEPTVAGQNSFEAQCELGANQVRCGERRLDPGARLTMTVVMTPTTVGDGRLTTTATVSAAQRELTPGDNRQALTTAIRPVLWGYVFRDGNGDGIRQGWESVGIEDARLFLEQGGLPVALAISKSPHGLFQFETLAGGEYALSAEVPPGYFLTVPAVIAINIKGDREQVAYFGAWTGEAEPPRGRLFLPLVLSPR